MKIFSRLHIGLIRFLTASSLTRWEREQKVVEQMIRYYCRKKEGHSCLCPDCEELIQYTAVRLKHCPFGEKKTTCQNCSIHCYSPKMKSRIKQVMRYSGPRMILVDPVAAIRHLLKI